LNDKEKKSRKQQSSWGKGTRVGEKTKYGKLKTSGRKGQVTSYTSIDSRHLKGNYEAPRGWGTPRGR